jgi:hypothetical protein
VVLYLTHSFVKPACGRDGAPHFSGIHNMQKISEWVRKLALVLLQNNFANNQKTNC